MHFTCDVNVFHSFNMTAIYYCRAGQTSSVFKLCRQDKSTVDRHIARRHGQSSKRNIIIKSFYDSDKTVASARECVLALKTTVDSKTTSSG